MRFTDPIILSNYDYDLCTRNLYFGKLMHVEDKVIKILTFNVALFERHDLMTR